MPILIEPAPGATSDGSERRTRLREYQVQLMGRMQAAKTGTAGASKALGVMLGERRCLLALTEIGEILPLGTLVPVPLTQDWYLGLANVRGGLTGIIDLARYRGEAAVAPGAEARLLSFSPRLGFNCALLVSRVLGLRDLALLQPVRAPDGAPDWEAEHFEDGDGAAWSRLELAPLLQQARFLQVGL